MLEQMERFGHVDARKRSYGYCIPFVEGERGGSCIARSIGNVQQVKIALQLAIFARSAVNADEYRVKTDVLAQVDAEIGTVHGRLAPIGPNIIPALRGDVYFVNVVFVCIQIILDGDGAFIGYYCLPRITAGNERNVLFGHSTFCAKDIVVIGY